LILRLPLPLFMKSGFVGIFGKPNAGKSTLLNALVGEKLAIVSPKVQTTRHRIKGILTGTDCQIIFSDTPGIIEPKYRLHEKMMEVVRASLSDADLVLLVVDVADNPVENDEMFKMLSIHCPAVLVVNKVDLVSTERATETTNFFRNKTYISDVVAISALHQKGIDELIEAVKRRLPEGAPYFDSDSLTDLPVKFFVGEIIREKIFFLYEEEIPYQATVVIQEFKDKSSLVMIRADIVVQRETQKGIILGEKGATIKRLGIESRKEIEAFVGKKVFLELFVKVRPKWRENDLYLREYGY